MPHNITETSTFSNADIALPDNGEVDGIESIEPAFVVAANRGRYARDLLLGHLAWSCDFSESGTSTVFTVTLGAINAVGLSTAGTPTEYFPHASAGGTASLGNVEGAPAALSADTWYYVYAYRSGTSLAYEISPGPSGAPNASRTFKTSNNTRRYLGCFPTVSGGAPLPLRAARGVYTYRRSALGATALRAATGTATSWTSVDLSAFIPPHARIARIELVAGSGGTAGSAQVRTTGDTGGGVYATTVTATALSASRAVFDIETDASRTIEYQVTHASITAEIFVHGFSE